LAKENADMGKKKKNGPFDFGKIESPKGPKNKKTKGVGQGISAFFKKKGKTGIKVRKEKGPSRKKKGVGFG